MSQAKGFLVVTCKIDKSKKEELKHYISGARPIFAQYGGRPSGQYEVKDTIIGNSQTTHIVVMEFPSVEAVQNVFKDPNYIALIPARTIAFPVLDILITEAFTPEQLLSA